ncbi:MarR family winged helix-turn-helix transcriptional regulator [Gloeobacter violaceus]|uniref:MarR family transcriptional regulatory protein n=1 Tax=Gloeobacter violaceus (strain ATCC 29082 / PCC 7421) TaxID=251221 RepID=Q7NFD0_GLOVI|nr:MarR family transcriptional regulator [Gloeobacter violaceus]BAC91537.1 MarR family transcriptional regulatory protein [Gloeobacter violaceus PCC 7421]
MFEEVPGAIESKVLDGLARIATVMKGETWQVAGEMGLTPTQVQILKLLHLRSQEVVRMSEVARELSVTPATASDAVGALIRKGLVARTLSPQDARAFVLTLTEAGAAQANRLVQWPASLLEAAGTLAPGEQAAMTRCLIKMIRSLQEQGQILPARMCVNCRYFRPHSYPGSNTPHHCAFVDAPFGDRNLRVECPDYERAEPQLADRNWSTFIRAQSQSDSSL